MKLNPDCIRAVLLHLEENQLMDDKGVICKIISSDLPDTLPSYTSADVIYTVKQLDEYGFISTRQFDTYNYMAAILDITPQGHEFLKDIHDDTTWNKTKDIAKNVGSYSLSTLAQIASSIISNVIAGML